MAGSVFAAAALISNAHAQTTDTFTGGAASLTLSSNWSAGTPTAGQSWWIGTTSAATLSYDFSSGGFPGFWTNGITFGPSSAAVTIGAGASNVMTLGGRLANLSSVTDSFSSNLSVALTSSLDVVTNASGGNFVLAGAISGAQGLAIDGGGVTTLSGQNSYTGATTISGLSHSGFGGSSVWLDFRLAQPGTTATGIISSASALHMNGGNLVVQGANGSVTTTQTFNGVTAGPGESRIWGLAGTNNGAVNITLGAINRQPGGILEMSPGPPIVNMITTTTNAVGGPGIISGGVFEDNDFFAVASGASATRTISALTNGIVQLPTGGTGVDITHVYDDHSGVFTAANTAVAGPVTIGGLVFDVSSAATLSIASGVMTINDGAGVGGVIINAGSATQTIQSGVGASLTAPNELVFELAGGKMNITAAISDSGTGTGTIVTLGGDGDGGGGVYTFSGTNTYAGQTYINSATLFVSANSGLGDVTKGSTLNLNGGTLGVSGSSFALDNGAGVAMRGIVLESNGGTLSPSSTFALTVDGVISGTGSLTISGAGTVNLSGANTYTGSTIIASPGILVLTGSAQLASPSITVAGIMRVRSGASLTGNSSNPTVTIAGGSLTMSNSQSMLLHDAGAGGTLTLSTTSKLSLTDGSSFGGVIAGASGTVAVSGAATLSGLNTYAGGTTLNSGALLAITNEGATSGTGSSGSLGLVPAAAATNVTFSASATLAFAANNLTLNANRTITIGSGVIASFDTRANTVTIAGAINGAGSLTKLGSGTLILSGTNNYVGPTLISAGTLNLTGALTGGGDVTVASGATFTATSLLAPGELTNNGSVYANTTIQSGGVLAGTGVIHGTLAMSDGSTYAPGNSPGMQTVDHNVTWGNMTYQMQIADVAGAQGVGYDSLSVTGSLNIVGTNIHVNVDSYPANSQVAHFSNGSPFDLILVSTTNGVENFVGSNFHVDTSLFEMANSLGGGSFSVILSPDGDDLFLHFTSAVPEPATLALFALSTAAIGWRVRRRR
jgi:autotransporter-associated beta strand protein